MSTQFDLGSARGEIRIETRDLDTARAKTTALSTSLQTNLKNIGTSLASTGKTFTTHFTLPIVAGLGFAVKSFNEAAQVQAQTQARLESTGGAANVTAEHVERLAGSIRDLSGIEDEAVQSGANMLLTFVNIRNEVGEGNNVFDQAVGTLANMSVALGQDMSQSAIQLGKALNDPIRGVTALRRVGVQLTDQQAEQVKQFVETNNLLGAQKVILAELNTEFGHSAEAQGKTPWGQTRIALSRVGDQFERLGGLVAPVLQKMAEGLESFVNFIVGLPAPVKTALGVLVGLFATLGPILFIVGKLTAALGFLITAWGALRLAMATARGEMIVTTGSMAALDAKVASSALSIGAFIGKIGLARIGLIGLGIAAGIGLVRHLGAADRKLEESREHARELAQEFVKAAIAGKRAFRDVPQDFTFDLAIRRGAIPEFIEQSIGGIADAFREGLISVTEVRTNFIDLLELFPHLQEELSRTATSEETATAATKLLAESAFKTGQITKDELVSSLVTLGLTYNQAVDRTRLLSNSLDQVGTKVDVTGKKIQSFAGLTIKSFEQWRKEVVSSIKEAAPALDRLAGRAKITAESIINSFKRQQRAFESYGENLAEFTDLNIPDELKKQIIDMGLEGAPVIEGFNDLTKRELREVSASFRAGQQAIKDTSEPLRGLMGDAERSTDRVNDLGNALGEIQRKYGNLQLNVNTTFTTDGRPPPDWWVRGWQSGGTVLQNEFAVVGERGPELVFLPKGASVLESEKTLRLLRQLSAGADARAPRASSGLSEAVIVLEVDGELLHRVVKIRERETRIRLGSRA